MLSPFDTICSRMGSTLAVHTYSDLTANLKFFFLVPAQLVLAVLDGTKPGAFFEITCDSGRGGGAWLFSGIVWFILVAFIASVLNDPQRTPHAREAARRRSKGY